MDLTKPYQTWICLPKPKKNAKQKKQKQFSFHRRPYSKASLKKFTRSSHIPYPNTKEITKSSQQKSPKPCSFPPGTQVPPARRNSSRKRVKSLTSRGAAWLVEKLRCLGFAKKKPNEKVLVSIYLLLGHFLVNSDLVFN